MIRTRRKLFADVRVLHAAVVVALLIIGCRAQSKTAVPPNKSEIPAKNSVPVKPASKVRFTSVYTKLDSKTCQPIAKAKSPEDEVPLICKGYQDYKIFLGEHGVNPPLYVGREISMKPDSWNPAELPVIYGGAMGQTIEWRLADGEPFAFIVRVEYDRATLDPDATDQVNELVVRNLKGFAPISITIDAKENKRANKAARRAADQGYGKL